MTPHVRTLPLLCPAPRIRGIKRWCASDACLSDVCLSVAYIGPKSRTERPRKTEIGTEVAHVTRDSDTTFKVKRWTCRGRGHIVAASLTACKRRIAVSQMLFIRFQWNLIGILLVCGRYVQEHSASVNHKHYLLMIQITKSSRERVT